MSTPANTDSTTPSRLFTIKGQAVATSETPLTMTERFNEYVRFGKEIMTSYILAIDPEPTGTLYAEACARWPDDEANFKRLKADFNAHGSDEKLDKLVERINVFHVMTAEQLQDRGFFQDVGSGGDVKK
jgi:hypothetical protein